MADSVVAGQGGHDYQARWFWILASQLRDPQRGSVTEVVYEANAPRAFDDVVVRYDPPTPVYGMRVSVSHHQVKYHVDNSGRFGYADLADPEFIGASTTSILQRLRTAKASAPSDSEFVLVTTDSISDGDLLGELVSKADSSIRLDRLKVGGGRSRMGKVRKCWRENAGLESDEQLYELLSAFRIQSGAPTLEHLRDQVNLHFKLVGLVPCHDTIEFRFDATARQLKAAGRNALTREKFEVLCREEGWIAATPPAGYDNVAIRSYPDGPAATIGIPDEQTLSLYTLFEDRQLRAGADWTNDVQRAVEEFLDGIRSRFSRVRLFLEAHLSISFLSGACLGLKSGVSVELVQKGRSGVSEWRADDGRDGPAPIIVAEKKLDDRDVAVVVSMSRRARADVDTYWESAHPSVGTVVHVEPADGPGQNAIKGGAHAAAISDAIAEFLRDQRYPAGTTFHFFIAAPGAVAFFLGQQRQAIGPCVLYEYDFQGRNYFPSLRIG